MIDPGADTIEIQDLRVRTVIGIFDHERDRRQEVRITLSIESDTRDAARSDAIEDALDYKTLTKQLIEMIEASSFQLLETLAQRIADLVLVHPRATAVHVQLEKPGALRFARTVGVSITRRSDR
ncbi:MAG: dihydroneopterin aldolase [Planctomycetes bacterium]|nr:dihydroneopterin aldolase [Planctomycetota bacterium]